MTTDQQRELFKLLRQYQVEHTIPESKLYMLCEQLTDELWPIYYNQRKEQPR